MDHAHSAVFRHERPRVRDWPVWSLPKRLIALLSVVTCGYLAWIGVYAGDFHLRWTNIGLFAALLACGAFSVEMSRRASQPDGVVKDVYAVWELPMVFLLPGLYALIVPAIRLTLTQWRVGRVPVYRRVYTAATIGIGYGCARLVYQSMMPRGLHARAYLFVDTPKWLVAAGLGDHDHGLDPVPVLELPDHRQDRVLLGLVPLEAADLEGEPRACRRAARPRPAGRPAVLSSSRPCAVRPHARPRSTASSRRRGRGRYRRRPARARSTARRSRPGSRGPRSGPGSGAWSCRWPRCGPARPGPGRRPRWTSAPRPGPRPGPGTRHRPGLRTPGRRKRRPAPRTAAGNRPAPPAPAPQRPGSRQEAPCRTAPAPPPASRAGPEARRARCPGRRCPGRGRPSSPAPAPARSPARPRCGQIPRAPRSSAGRRRTRRSARPSPPMPSAPAESTPQHRA